MNIRTYRVHSMSEAIELIRDEMGTQGSVLHTRRIHQPWWRRLGGARCLEVVASNGSNIPSRFADRSASVQSVVRSISADQETEVRNNAAGDADAIAIGETRGNA